MKTIKPKSKSQILKNILKEAIREVIREELPQIIREELQSTKPLINGHQDFVRDFTPNYKEFLPKTPAKPIGPNYSQQNVVSMDPIKRILAQTAKNMTPDDFRTIQMNSDMVEMNNGTGVTNGMLAQNLNIGEMHEYQPSNMKDFNFPM